LRVNVDQPDSVRARGGCPARLILDSAKVTASVRLNEIRLSHPVHTKADCRPDFMEAICSTFTRIKGSTRMGVGHESKAGSVQPGLQPYDQSDMPFRSHRHDDRLGVCRSRRRVLGGEAALSSQFTRRSKWQRSCRAEKQTLRAQVAGAEPALAVRELSRVFITSR
jgi:hypothetical protein